MKSIVLHVTDGLGRTFIDDRWTRFDGGGIAGKNCKPPRPEFRNKLFVGNLSFQGPVEGGREYLSQWLDDTYARKGKESFRDIQVEILDRDGGTEHTLNFFECFLTSYTLSPLDGSAGEVEATETIEIVVGYSDNLLG